MAQQEKYLAITLMLALAITKAALLIFSSPVGFGEPSESVV